MPYSQPVPKDAAAPVHAVTACWRCGLAASANDLKCPHCEARLRSAVDPVVASGSAKKTPADPSLNLLLVTYAVLLGTGIVHALLFHFDFNGDRHFDQAERTRAFTQIAIVEVIDTVVIAWAVIASWSQFSRPKPILRTRLVAWGVSLPVLATLLTVNYGYHALLRSILHIPLAGDELFSQLDLIALITICVQPAIAEEAYCRLFALDCLQRVLGMHASVWISATMFAFMHVAVMGSVPYLLLFGAVMAYMRCASGSILLPMILHFLHNVAVFWFEFADG